VSEVVDLGLRKTRVRENLYMNKGRRLNFRTYTRKRLLLAEAAGGQSTSAPGRSRHHGQQQLQETSTKPNHAHTHTHKV
jgi:hypothetical protein